MTVRLFSHLRRERGMALDEVVEHLSYSLAVRLHLAGAADLVPKRGRNPDDPHAVTVPRLQNST